MGNFWPRMNGGKLYGNAYIGLFTILYIATEISKYFTNNDLEEDYSNVSMMIYTILKMLYMAAIIFLLVNKDPPVPQHATLLILCTYTLINTLCSFLLIKLSKYNANMFLGIRIASIVVTTIITGAWISGRTAP